MICVTKFQYANVIIFFEIAKLNLQTVNLKVYKGSNT